MNPRMNFSSDRTCLHKSCLSNCQFLSQCNPTNFLLSVIRYKMRHPMQERLKFASTISSKLVLALVWLYFCYSYTAQWTMWSEPSISYFLVTFPSVGKVTACQYCTTVYIFLRLLCSLTSTNLFNQIVNFSREQI